MRKSDNITFAFILTIIVSFVGVSYIQYDHTEVKTLTIHKVTSQQHTSGDSEHGVHTYYEYLVSTDKGTYEISPSGIYSSSCFGNLEEGHTYKCFIRGYAVPVLGVYPNIIDAKEIEQ